MLSLREVCIIKQNKTKHTLLTLDCIVKRNRKFEINVSYIIEK